MRTRSLVTTLNKFPVAEKFIVNRSPIFVNFNTGTVVPVEQGQADGSVLIAHNGSLVYFATIVNDVYAYYLTGRKGGAIGPTWPTPGQFPVSQAALNQITGFAGKTFVDDIALAIEVKTAWVELSTLPRSAGLHPDDGAGAGLQHFEPELVGADGRDEDGQSRTIGHSRRRQRERPSRDDLGDVRA